MTPQVVIIAGPNGSGKSTLTPELQGTTIPLPVNYINADEMAKQMQSEMPAATQRQREQEAFLRARALRQRYREQRVSFAFETVFSHPSTLLDMANLKQAGYDIVLVVVTTADADINVQRVKQRVKAGGHNVQEAKIRDRYERFMRLLPRAVEMADQALIFDATESTRFCCTFGRKSVQNYVPAYLQSRLLDPLTERRSSRQNIQSHLLPTETLQLPDEQNGVYEGTIRAASSWHCLQETSGSFVILHDRLLLTGDVQQGSPVRITYTDGVGHVSID